MDWLGLQFNLAKGGGGGGHLTVHEVQDEAELIGGVEGIRHTHDEGAVLQRQRVKDFEPDQKLCVFLETVS